MNIGGFRYEGVMISARCLYYFKKPMHHKEKLFALMFRRHYDAMYRFAFSFLRDYEESRDVVSEVFARLWDEGKPLKQDTQQTEEAVSAADAAHRRAG